ARARALGRSPAARAARPARRQPARHAGAGLCHRHRRRRPRAAGSRQRRSRHGGDGAARARAAAGDRHRRRHAHGHAGGHGRKAVREQRGERSMRKLARATAVLLALATMDAAALPEHAPRPGGIAIIELGDAAAAPGTVPVVTFGERRALVVERDGGWVAVVGIPLEQDIGTARIRVSGDADGEPVELPFEVLLHAYGEQRLTVSRAYVEPAPADLERIAREREILDRALGTWREAPFADIRLAAPVAGRRSPSFGFRRWFNDEPRAPHKGMDIAAPAGTPVAAAADGQVTV